MCQRAWTHRARGRPGPAFVIDPRCRRSAELASRGTNPREAVARPASGNRPIWSSVARSLSAVTGPTPGAVIHLRVTGSAVAAWYAQASASRSGLARPSSRSVHGRNASRIGAGRSSAANRGERVRGAGRPPPTGRAHLPSQEIDQRCAHADELVPHQAPLPDRARPGADPIRRAIHAGAVRLRQRRPVAPIRRDPARPCPIPGSASYADRWHHTPWLAAPSAP